MVQLEMEALEAEAEGVHQMELVVSQDQPTQVVVVVEETDLNQTQLLMVDQADQEKLW
jgi:hypothetical protein